MDVQYIIEEKKPELTHIFKQHDVVLAYLYGSQARGEGGPLSDVDIAVLFTEDVNEKDRFQRVLRLIGELGHIFSRDDVQVVDLSEASPLMRHRIYYSGQVLYCADEAQRVRFSERALHEYVDTAPLRRIKKKYVLKRISEAGE